MQRSLWFLIAASFVLSSGLASAQQRFPRVYGSTGHPYGPTQAAYQYERQYGRPWHGYGGYSSNVTSSNVIVNGYPGFVNNYWGTNWVPNYYGFGYGYGYGWPGYAVNAPLVATAYPLYPPAIGLGFYAPGVTGNFGIYGSPGTYVPYPDYGLARTAPAAPLSEAWQENQQRWGDTLPDVKPDPVMRPVIASSTEAKLRSIRAQASGDENLREQKWLQAYIDYKKAVQLAEDRAEAHLRLGFALVALQHFETAAVEWKRALRIDPNLPQTATDSATLFGPGNELARISIQEKLTEYVKQDLRDPDRLFLLGMLLHFENDDRSREVLETGLRLAGHGNHFLALLKPASANPPAGQAVNPAVQPGAPAVLPPPPKAAPVPQLPPPPVPNDDAARAPQGPTLLPNS